MTQKTLTTAEVFIILTQDRHVDVDAEVMRDEQKAIDRAREIAKKNCRHTEDYMERKIADWVFHADYSCEGDSVTVLRREIKG